MGWRGVNQQNSTCEFTDNGSSRVSSIFVEDASYLRLKILNSDTLYKHQKKLGMQNIRIYMSGQNLFTLTGYSGLDPESTDLIDMGTYPQSRSFICGINLSF